MKPGFVKLAQILDAVIRREEAARQASVAKSSIEVAPIASSHLEEHDGKVRWR